MRVRMLGDISGTRDGQPWPPRGAEVDVPDDEALMLVRNRMAAPVATTLGGAGVERAVLANVDVEPRGEPRVAAAPATGAMTVEPAGEPAGPVTTDPVTTDPVTTDPVTTDPVTTDPGPLTTQTGPARRRGRGKDADLS